MPEAAIVRVDLHDGAAYNQVSVRRQAHRGYFSGAVAANEVVSVNVADTTYGLGGSFKKAAATADDPTAVGVATGAIAAGGIAEYQTYGPAYAIADAGGWAAGDSLQVSATAGRLAIAGGNAERRVAIALEAAAANETKRVFLQFPG